MNSDNVLTYLDEEYLKYLFIQRNLNMKTCRDFYIYVVSKLEEALTMAPTDYENENEK